jgi:hypothetical protein
MEMGKYDDGPTAKNWGSPTVARRHLAEIARLAIEEHIASARPEERYPPMVEALRMFVYAEGTWMREKGVNAHKFDDPLSAAYLKAVTALAEFDKSPPQDGSA